MSKNDRILDPHARVRSFSARHGGMRDEVKLRRQLAGIERALAPMEESGEVPADWSMIEQTDTLPEPSDDTIGRMFLTRNAEADDVINIGLKAADGTPILVGLNTLAPGEGEYVLSLAYLFGSGPSASNGFFDEPTGIAVDPAGNRYVVDNGNNRVQKFNAAGVWQLNIATGLSNPRGIAYMPVSGNLVVTEHGANQVKRYTTAGSLVATYTGSGLSGPTGVAVTAADTIIIADTGNSRVQVLSSSGVFSGNAGVGLLAVPLGVAVNASLDIAVADTGNHSVKVFNSVGVLQFEFGSFGNANGQFSNPTGIDFDSLGNIYVVDGNNHRIQMFDSTGAFIAKVGKFGSGGAELNSPYLITIDANDIGYVADKDNHRISTFRADERSLSNLDDLLVIVPHVVNVGAVATNASLVTYQTHLTMTDVLPAGTWDITTEAHATYTNNAAGGGFQLRITSPVIGSLDPTDQVTAQGRSVLHTYSRGNVVSDGSTATTFTAQYRALVGGTASALNATLIATCRRVA